MNKKIVLAAVAVLATAVVFARPPHGGPHPGGWGRPGPAPMFHGGPRPGPHHGSFWGRGGRNFWGGVVGGAIGAAAFNAMVTPRTHYYNSGYYSPAPVVVAPAPVYSTPTTVTYTQPVTVPTTTYVSQPVVVTPAPNVYRQWVPGRYEYQTINGVTSRIYIPGHYESTAY